MITIWGLTSGPGSTEHFRSRRLQAEALLMASCWSHRDEKQIAVCEIRASVLNGSDYDPVSDPGNRSEAN